MANSQPARPASVSVLGAGMSGMVAAYELQRSGYEVQVFEGRDVPGGRVQTMRQGLTGGQYAEAGAMFMAGQDSLTKRYADIFQVKQEGFADNGLPSLYYLRGQRIVDPPPAGSPPASWPFDLTPLELKLGFAGINSLYTRANLKSVSSTEDEPAPSDGVLDQISFDVRMHGLGASEAARTLLSYGFNSVYGDGPATYSALLMLYDSWYGARHPHGFQVVGGNDIYPKLMAAALGNRIQYNSRVLAIARGDSSVRIAVESGGTQHEVESDYVICALPYTVLRDLPVSPPLTQARREAIEDIPSTSVIRVAMQFKEPFWLKENLNGLVISDLRLGITYPQDLPSGQSTILNQYICGDSARELSGCSEAELIQFTLTRMARFFPQAPSYFVTGVTKVWDTDPWARGAYASFRPFQLTNYIPVLRMPEGRLHFAGDYTSLLPGWIDGALNSGIRAANAVANASGVKLAFAASAAAGD